MSTLIFDMDGVLVDSEPFHLETEQLIFRELGIAMSHAEHERFVGMASLMMWTQVREEYGLTQPAEELKELEVRRKVAQLRVLPIEPTPGIPGLIHALEAAGTIIALASSAPRAYIDVITDRTGLRPHFRVLVSGDDVRAGKPEPDIFLRTAELLHTAPGACVVIEDSTNGVRAARAAGMRCIAYRNPNSGRQDISQADLIVEDFSQASIDRILELVI